MARTFLTTKDLAKRYHKTPKTIREWIKREENPFPKPMFDQRGSSSLWLESDIEEWEDSL